MAAGITLLLLSFLPTLVIEMPALNLGPINADYQTQQIEWVQTITFLTGAVVTFGLGRLSDAYGKKRLLVIGLVAVLAGSLLCATTHNFILLLAGRMLQGFVASNLLQTYGLTRDLVPRRRIPAAVAITAIGFALGAPASIILGSVLTQRHDYTYMFWWTSAATALALLLTLVAIPESPLRTPELPDWPGIGMASTAAFSITYGLNEVTIPGRGWTSAWTIGFILLGACLAVAFYAYERRPESHRLDTGVLRSTALRRTLATALFYGILIAALQALTTAVGETPPQIMGLRLGYGFGLTANQLGWRQVPVTAVSVVLTVLAVWYVRRRGARLTVIVAAVASLGAAVAVGFAATSLSVLTVALALTNLGSYLYFTGSPLLLMESVPAHYQGYAAGLFFTVLNIGNSTASQFVTALFAQKPAFTNPLDGTSVPSWNAVHLSVVVMSVLGVLGVIVSVLVRHGRAPSIGGALADATYRAHTSDAPLSGRHPDSPAVASPRARRYQPGGALPRAFPGTHRRAAVADPPQDSAQVR